MRNGREDLVFINDISYGILSSHPKPPWGISVQVQLLFSTITTAAFQHWNLPKIWAAQQVIHPYCHTAILSLYPVINCTAKWPSGKIDFGTQKEESKSTNVTPVHYELRNGDSGSPNWLNDYCKNKFKFVNRPSGWVNFIQSYDRRIK